jgi:hypothetical protein
MFPCFVFFPALMSLRGSAYLALHDHGTYGIFPNPCIDYSLFCCSDFQASYRCRGKTDNVHDRCTFRMKKPLIASLSFPVAPSVLRTSEWSLSALPIHRAETFKVITANLLVVNLHVTTYKPKRGESREILPLSRYEGTGASEEAELLPGRHDLVRIFGSSLAADRGRSPHHRYDPSAHL